MPSLALSDIFSLRSYPAETLRFCPSQAFALLQEGQQDLREGLSEEFFYLRFHLGPRSQGWLVGYGDLHRLALYLVIAFDALT